MGTLTKIGVSAITILLILCGIFFWLWRGTEVERQRLQSNQNTLLEKVDYYQTEANHNAASVAALTLTNKEIKAYNQELVKTCDELNISIRRLISASMTGMQSNYHIQGDLKPIVVSRDSASIDTARCMNYYDPHLSFTCCVDSSDFIVADIQTRDTIKSVLHRVPRKFLWFKFGTKEVRQEIFSTNPNTHIICSELIEKK